MRKRKTRLRRLLRRLDGKGKEPSAAVIDSQSVRSNAHGGPVGYDAGKKTKGRKRFVCVDILGWLLGVAITPANITERCGAKELLRPVLRGHRLKKIWADGGFSGSELSGWVRSLSRVTTVEIIKRISTEPGFHVLPKRWVVERTFAWLVQHRRLVRDYEQSLHSATAWVFLAMIRVMINRYS